MTTNRPDEQAWISLAVPGQLMGSLQVFRIWSANLSYCNYRICDDSPRWMSRQPRACLGEEARQHLTEAADGRLRLRYSPSAAVAAWR